MTRRLLSLLLPLLLLTPRAAQAVQPPTLQSPMLQSPTVHKLLDSGVLLGHRAEGLPFSYVAPDGRVHGYAVDLCLALLNALNRELKPKQALRAVFVPVGGNTRIEALQSGRADIECGHSVALPERRKEIAFSMPIFFSGPRILTRDGAPIRNFFDLEGRKVVIVAGSSSGKLLRERVQRGLLQRLTFVEVEDHDDALALVDKGGADAYVTTGNLLYARRAMSRTPQKFAFVGAHLVVEPIALMLRKDDPALKHFVDRELSTLMLNGSTEILYSKWFRSPVPPNGVRLDMPLHHLLRDQFLWPTDR